MNAEPSSTTRCRQHGFTLLELLLVLAVMAIIAALAVPLLFGSMDNLRLKRSADLLRAEWSKARTNAIRTGRTQVFRYEAGNNQYVIEPWFAEDDLLESSATSATRFTAAADPTVAVQPKLLPENVVFAGGELAADTRGQEIEQSLSAASRFSTTAARPILFYPDGTTSTARILLVNSREQYVAIELRGLTGVARVSDILSSDELPQ